MRATASEAEADGLLEAGEVQFVVTIPADFTRDLLRGERPALLVEADATDPAATGNARRGAHGRSSRTRAATTTSTGPLADSPRRRRRSSCASTAATTPKGITAYNIVPGLIGVILTMTMVMMTALAMTRERERGTMENLLAMPVRPLEVMIGKIVPYILVGYVQASVILLAARFLFDVPMAGDLVLLAAGAVLFIAANLAVGITFSTVAQNQLQAMQMTFFFFLPSILLSGFMFPFRGMPEWAQSLGEVLPLTHFLRIVRGILLKGNGARRDLPELWPLLAFLLAAGTIALLRYRQTLD